MTPNERQLLIEIGYAVSTLVSKESGLDQWHRLHTALDAVEADAKQDQLQDRK